MFYVRIGRQPERVVPRHLAMAVFLCSLIALAGPAHGQSAYCPIGTPTIWDPEPGDVWASGGGSYFACCIHPTDLDKDADENIVYDDVTVYWTLTGPGTCKWGDFIGWKVLVDTTNGSGDLTLTSHAKNDYMDGESDDTHHWMEEGPSYSWDDGGDRPTKYVADTIIAANSDDVTVKVVKVDTLVWETRGSNTALDTCENNGDDRIYPGQQDQDDTSAAYRKTVYIKATITPAVANGRVYFSVWDVDDPSSSTSPIDTNDILGVGFGGDNRGSSSLASPSYADTNASGEAMIIFTVSLRPGDNYKATAATSLTRLNEMTAIKAEQSDAYLPDTVKRSGMLTVWRKVYIELDSMQAGTLADNLQSGTVAEALYDGPSNTTSIEIEDVVSDFEKDDQFNGGYITIAVIGTLSVVDFEANTGNENVFVSGNQVAAYDKVYSVYDDDMDYVGGSIVYKFSLPDDPDTSTVAAKLQPAYVTPVVDATTDSIISFDRNINSTSEFTAVTDSDRQYLLSKVCDSFISVHLVGAFQPGADVDNDPSISGNDESEVYGEALESNMGILIYFETLRDALAAGAGAEELVTVVHELGHCLGPDHGDGGIMADGPSFSDISLDKIRDKTY